MIYFIEALKYVMSDPYFTLSMGFTASIGIFIGALLYDGILPEVKKGIVAIGFYAFLLSMTNFGRILPIIISGDVHDIKQPFAGIATILFVTIFYILGMFIGVFVTNKAHGGKHDDRRKTDVKNLNIK